MHILIQCLYGFLTVIGFCIIFNVKGKMIFFAALGGTLGVLAFELLTGHSEIVRYFAASLTVSLYSEIIARLAKAPVTISLIPGLIPFVPGGGIFYTMEYFINGNTTEFLSSFVNTVSIAGALTFGALVMSSLFRILYTSKERRQRLRPR